MSTSMTKSKLNEHKIYMHSEKPGKHNYSKSLSDIFARFWQTINPLLKILILDRRKAKLI